MTHIVLPEISFLKTDAQQLANDIIATYENAEGRKLALADPLRLIFLSLASVITKQNVAINDAAKQNLTYYARDEVLDHKGAELDTPRLLATAAKTTLRMHLSIPLTSSKVIVAGSLMATSTDGEMFFASTHDVVIEPSDLFVDVELECTVKGRDGNDYAPGQIDTLVKPLPYIDRVENITVSAGGAVVETDDAYRERVYMAPEKFSTAGPTGSYLYYAKSASALISDVYVYSSAPGHTDIKILLENGRLPTQEIINKVFEKVNHREVRPLTDLVSVGPPEIVNFDLDITYFIETNAIDKSLIHQNIEKAVAEYKLWQSSKIGRDINPSKLTTLCVRAGAKRIVINSPEFIVIEEGQVAVIANENVSFGGVEDD